MINVTKSYLPPFEDYSKLLKDVWESGWLTNNGKFVQELEKKLKDYLGVKHLFYCTNGTVVMQLALKALNLKKEIITTPYSYVATTNVILWEECTPVFVDINENDFNIDAGKIEEAITPNTEAILVTHVYGNPCDIDAIKAIALKHNLKVIYDGAHAFGSIYRGKQILSYGDVSTCSFHATKLFHTVEGGAIITNDDALAEKLFHYRQFGHLYDDYISIGINAKNSEFHAAMGLCVLPKVPEIIERRKTLCELYTRLLSGLKVKMPKPLKGTSYNYAYYPVVFESEEVVLKVIKALLAKDIHGRRYFYPSLNNLPFVKYTPCPVSEKVSSSVLSLPLFYDLPEKTIEEICGIIKQVTTH